MIRNQSRPKDLEDRIAYLEGEVDCLRFMIAGLLLRILEGDVADLMSKKPENILFSGDDQMYMKGYINSFQKLNGELEAYIER